jgi:tol-pal system protein YbgF
VNLALSCAVVLVLAACKHNDGMPDRQMSEMNETVGKLQVEQDKENHGFLSESMPATGAPKGENPAAAKTAAAPPRAVQISDDVDDHANDDPEAPDARPEIKLQGSGGGYRAPSSSSKGNKSRGETRSTDDSLSTDGSRSSAIDPEAKKAYDSAIQLVNSKQYDRALEELTAFQNKWPNHPYAENATYWRGECLYATGQYLRAAEQFENVINRYGGGKKGPDALLKLGMCQDRLGASDRAREYWDRLRRDFPHSDAVKKIPVSETTRRTAGPKESR